MNSFKDVLKHNVGCLSSWKSTQAELPSTNSGRHAGSPIAADDFARLNRQSSSAKTRIARNHNALSASNSLYTWTLYALITVLRVSRASLSCRIFFCREPTTHRFLAYECVVQVISELVMKNLWNSPSSRWILPNLWVHSLSSRPFPQDKCPFYLMFGEGRLEDMLYPPCSQLHYASK